MSSVVKLSGIRKVFVDARRKREAVAVERFDLEIGQGELVTLLGPSGCGKTTVLRMLAGFETPTEGRIIVNGKDITDLAANERNCAMVFQSYALFPHMNVVENICYGLKLRRVSKAETKERLDRILDVVNLRGYEERRPSELSGGQQQRVALARALIIEPSLLLFDEPLSNLDAKLREFMRNEIRKVQQKLSITAVYVTHDQSEAMAISDRVVVMNKARIEQIGTATEIYHRPATKFVADFMGAANFVPQGDRVMVVRPESVRVGADSGEGLAARVKSRHFLGSFHEYQVEIEGGNLITARVAALADEATFAPGSGVKVSFDARGTHYLPASAEGSQR